MVRKLCNSCLEEKPINQFHQESSKIDGYSYYCKSCVKSYDREHKYKLTKEEKLKDALNYKEYYGY